MKVYLLIRALCFVGLSLTINSLWAQETPDFRKVRWGFNPKQVRETETAKPLSAKREKLVYTQIPLADRLVGLEYTFDDDSLRSASYYYYATASVSKDDVLAAATTFQTALTEKYGPGKASLAGDIKTVMWLTPRTQITLSVGNVDKGWSVEIQYLGRLNSQGQFKNGTSATATNKPLKGISDF